MRKQTSTASPPFSVREGWRYGLMGLPLAFVALPLYVVLPNHYARNFGMSLATLGALLLGARLLDAVIDPLLGRWADRLFARSATAALRWAAIAAFVLALGFYTLFFPLVRDASGLLIWAGAGLVVTYAAYSALAILHQSWGAMLGGDETQRGRVVAWREGLGLIGVILASLTPVAFGLPATVALLAAALAAGWWAWSQARKPDTADNRRSGSLVSHGRPASLWLPFTRRDFRALLAVFVVNGIASAVPATLILFFVQDRLHAPANAQTLFLGVYFVCAACAIPAWLAWVRRIGLARSWLYGMLLSIAVFVGASRLGSGDSLAFAIVCALSGTALGADLTMPGALLAGTIAKSGDQGLAEGAYFGWWNFATKLNLALAAGLSLPVLGWLGYVPGTLDPKALEMLTLVYCLLPCALKAIAALLLYTLILKRSP